MSFFVFLFHTFACSLLVHKWRCRSPLNYRKPSHKLHLITALVNIYVTPLAEMRGHAKTQRIHWVLVGAHAIRSVDIALLSAFLVSPSFLVIVVVSFSGINHSTVDTYHDAFHRYAPHARQFFVSTSEKVQSHPWRESSESYGILLLYIVARIFS